MKVVTTSGHRRHSSTQPKLAPWLFLFPALLLFVFIFVLPITYTIMQSFLKPGQKKLLYAPSGHTAPQFAGISQYTAAFQDSHFLLSIGRVLLIGVVQVPLMLLFSVCLALLLDARRVKARQGFQLAYFLPYAVPGAISALMWTFLLQPQLSPFTSLFQKMGLNLNLLAPSVVPISVGNMITWGFAGYNMVVIYSALKAPPNEILEAAHVDGASSWRTAWQIKVPMVRPAVIMTAVFSIIGTIQLYNEPAILRNSAPRIDPDFSPIMAVYNLVTTGDYFGAAARSVILAVITLVASFGFLKLQSRRGGAFDE